MRAPQGCLRSVRRPRERPTTWILCPSHLSTPRHSDSHPRGCPTIHLSKSFSHTSPTTFVAFAVVVPRQGRRIIASLPPLSTGYREDFSGLRQTPLTVAGTCQSRTYRLLADENFTLTSASCRTLHSTNEKAPGSLRGRCKSVAEQQAAFKSLFATVQAPRLTLGRW